ncbi:zinc finger protein 687a-like isoform X2 [Myxocyprinus asiaticus]|nr:zinc finger protein 687a-like isoform X2 [Myxocyprinus asiaticus]XP_051574700.1 zinc finger protein 687a-like isoform X2 [Myxocyprinus asiaticus]
MGMGDMKTPDFDDLLAAFDIPDIDAKEAIQSDTVETDGNHNEPSGFVGKERRGSPRPTGHSENPETIPLAPHNDPSVVSVIVKNSVRSDAYMEANDDDDKMDMNIAENFAATKRCVDGSQVSPQQGPSEDGLVLTDPFIYNGLRTISGGVTEPSPLPFLTQTQPNRQLWSVSASGLTSECSDDNQDGISSKHSASTFSPPQTLPPSTPPNSSSYLIGPIFPPSKFDGEEAQQLNGILRVSVRRHFSEDEESEPDLGSPPLVIQESPDSQLCSAPKVPRRHQPPSSVFQPPSPSSPSLPVSNTQIEESAPSVHHPVLLQNTVNLNTNTSMTSKNELPVEEKNLEHIFEERDSPESPEPEIPTCTQMSSVSEVLKKSPPPPQTCTSLPLNQQGVNEPGLKRGDTALEDQVIDMSLGVKEQEKSGLHVKTENDGVEKTEVKVTRKSTEPSLANSVSEGITNSSTTSSKPLKVRIKTIQTSTGNITRTVSRVAPKRAAAGASKGPDGSKVPKGARKSIQQIQRSGAVPQGHPQVAMLPVSTLQDASTAMLFAASRAQNKMTTTLSATAVNITRTSTLPAVSTSSMTGMNICSLGQKKMNGNPGTAKPASIVNSPGAVISRSQSSLVEAFNKILNSKNPLPSYQPDLSTFPPPEWGLQLPSTGYRCLECGDAFALELSLARHYDRRSMRIEVTCNHCSKRVAFFNKCSLLLHAREHKEKGLVMQCSHLVMSPVSVEQMIGQQDTVPIGILCPPAPGSSALLGVKESSIQLSQSSDICCPECLSPFKGKVEIAAHFQELEAGGIETCCMQCSPPMPLLNSCSAAAHRRLHQQLSPLVCPECGVICQLHNLNTHLNQICLHYSRRLGYRCGCCHLVFGGVNSLNAVKSHMQTAHCEVFHKCPSCPMAFKSSSGAEAHCIAQHPELPETSRQSKEIYKCVMCRTVFTQKALLSVHIDTHLVKQKMHVFKCPDCNKLFTQRHSLIEHVKDSHRDSSVQQNDISAHKNLVKMESSDGEEWGRDEEEDRGRGGLREENSAAPDIQSWSCSECQTRYAEKENYINHMSEQHGKELKKFPCTLCEGSFSSSSSLRRHIRVKHKGIKRAFYCQCKFSEVPQGHDTLLVLQSLECKKNGAEKKHPASSSSVGEKGLLLTEVRGDGQTGRFCTGGKKSFSSKLILEKHIQAQHGFESGAATQGQAVPHIADTAGSSSGQDGVSSILGGALMKAESRLAESSLTSRGRGAAAEGFHCMPCGFATEDREEFLQHIACHRSDGGSAFQCQQCGACFASNSSLSRHLFISHRVRDVPSEHAEVSIGTGYTSGNVNSYPAVVAGSPGSPSSIGGSQMEDGEGKHICKVCGRHFNKPADLNTHFRTHGMAFITTYKSDKPA